jgi:hypothetical protein
MTQQSDIAYISGLLNAPASITDGDDVASLLQKYPYFTPLHYIRAATAHRQEAFSAEMLSAIHPHTGNWLLFCDFVDTASGAIQPPAFEPAYIETESVTATEEVVEWPPLPEAIEEEEEPVIDVPGEVEYISAAPEEEYPQLQEVTEDPEPVTEEAHSTQETKAEIPENVVHMDEVIEDAIETGEAEPTGNEELILPVYTDDYFRHQGVKVAEELPEFTHDWKNDRKDEEAKSLMVMMSFAEWLQHFRSSTQKQKEESDEQRALKSMWQKEKLAAAAEEENDEIPEKVFEMAVNSITKEEDLASEPLAEIYIKQGKYDKAIDMYRKLSLRNPQKNAYFARKIEETLKEKQS